MVILFGTHLNTFRLLADSCHVFAVLFLLFRLVRSKSSRGISGKSQLLFSLVFVNRYLDLFTNFISVYNTLLKIAFIVCTLTTVVLVFYVFRDKDNLREDKFRIEFLVIPCAYLALFLNHDGSSPLEVLWTFSVYLEAVAILPQLVLTDWVFMGKKKKKNEEDEDKGFLDMNISLVSDGKQFTKVEKDNDDSSNNNNNNNNNNDNNNNNNNSSSKDKYFIFVYLIPLGAYRALYIGNWVYRYQTEGFYDAIAIVAGCLETGIYLTFFTFLIMMGIWSKCRKDVIKYKLMGHDIVLRIHR